MSQGTRSRAAGSSPQRKVKIFKYDDAIVLAIILIVVLKLSLGQLRSWQWNYRRGS